MRKIRNLLIVPPLALTLLYLLGCASPGKSIGAGAATGGVVGAGVGAIADPGQQGENRVRNVVIGTAVGAAVGAGAGYVIDRSVHDAREGAVKDTNEQATREANAHAAAATGLEPRLIPPRTEARWIRDQVRGSTFVPGHFEYVIVEGARWETGK